MGDDRVADPSQRARRTTIRTYPICPAHPHHHGESLRTIVRRLERQLERESRPARQLAFPSPVRVARRTF